ncbi:hypothetical protein R3P38DRAFT_3212988 [Favolaschia claudopus]|uniref:SWIM-type domain-containing protein n=1 Tax=Favolaschia claudopus TaxID=2862362 RepID=A0AAW0AEU1_9AGAR
MASRGSLQDPDHPRYHLYIHRDGYGGCTCPDFTSRGAACKHLRALRLILDDWVARNYITPFYYPTTLDAAKNVRRLVLNGPGSSHSSGASVLHTFLALHNAAGEDITASDDNDGGEDAEAGLAGQAEFPFDQAHSPSADHELESNQDWIAVPNHAQAAISTQIQLQTEHTARSLLPRLHGLCSLLQNTQLTRSETLTEVQTTLNNTHLNLSKALPPLPLPTIPPPAHVRQEIHHPRAIYTSGPSAGLRRPALVVVHVPSPEPRQYRKPSHSTM